MGFQTKCQCEIADCSLIQPYECILYLLCVMCIEYNVFSGEDCIVRLHTTQRISWYGKSNRSH